MHLFGLTSCHRCCTHTEFSLQADNGKHKGYSMPLETLEGREPTVHPDSLFNLLKAEGFA